MVIGRPLEDWPRSLRQVLETLQSRQRKWANFSCLNPYSLTVGLAKSDYLDRTEAVSTPIQMILVFGKYAFRCLRGFPEIRRICREVSFRVSQYLDDVSTVSRDSRGLKLV